MTRPQTATVTSILVQFMLRGLGIVMGLLTAVGVAALFGAGAAADAFFFMRRLMGNWTLIIDMITQTTLVPRIVASVARDGLAEARKRLRPIEIGFTVAGLVAAVILVVFADPITTAMAPGMTGRSHDLASEFLQYLGVALPAIAATSVSAAFLNATGQFALPVILRLMPRVLILIALVGVPFGVGIKAVALAAIAGQFFTLGFYTWARLRVTGKAAPQPKSNVKEKLERDGAMANRTVAISVASVYFVSSTLAENYFASLAGVGAIAILTLAQRISNIGITEMMRSMMTVYYTRFAEHAAAGDDEAAADDIANALRTALFFTAPVALFIAVMAPELADLLLGYGAFQPESVALVAHLVTLFALSSISFVPSSVFEVALMSRPNVAQARHFIMSMSTAFVVRLALMVVLMPIIGLEGLGWAAIGATLPLSLLHGWRLRSSLGADMSIRHVKDGANVLLSGLLAAVAAWALSAFWPDGTGKLSQIAVVASAGTVFAAIYIGSSLWFGQPEARTLLRKLGRALRR